MIMKKNYDYGYNDIGSIYQDVKNAYHNKYFNIFLASLKFGNLRFQQRDFILRKFWNEGNIACWKIDKLDELGFADFTAQEYDMYDLPSKVRLTNIRGTRLIPRKDLIVDKDVAICYILPNHKSIKSIVEYYVERIVSVEMVINTNLNLHKIPFIIGVSPADKAKAKAIIGKILNNELVVFTDLTELNVVQNLSTNAPYIIDKLYSYKTSLENELMTLLGIDNASVDLSKDRMLVDEVNANNAMINLSLTTMVDNIQEWLDKINELFGIEVTIEPRVKPVDSVHEEGLGDVGTYDGNDGGKETQTNERN